MAMERYIGPGVDSGMGISYPRERTLPPIDPSLQTAKMLLAMAQRRQEEREEHFYKSGEDVQTVPADVFGFWHGAFVLVGAWIDFHPGINYPEVFGMSEEDLGENYSLYQVMTGDKQWMRGHSMSEAMPTLFKIALANRTRQLESMSNAAEHMQSYMEGFIQAQQEWELWSHARWSTGL